MFRVHASIDEIDYGRLLDKAPASNVLLGKAIGIMKPFAGKAVGVLPPPVAAKLLTTLAEDKIIELAKDYGITLSGFEVTPD